MKLITVEEFLEEHPHITMLGLAWACWWRLMVALYGGIFVFMIGLSLIAEL